MPKFLIEVPHAADVSSCARVVEMFLKTGSHFLTNAEWGCLDGDHRGVMIVEVDSREDARALLPPPLRENARIVALNRFSLDEIGNIYHHHGLQ